MCTAAGLMRRTLWLAASLFHFLHVDTQDVSVCPTQGNSLLQSATLMKATVKHKLLREASKEPLEPEEPEGPEGPEEPEEFGPAVYLFNSSTAQNAHFLVVRPLFKKTYRCKTSEPRSCQECTKGKGCFKLKRDRDGAEFLRADGIRRGNARWKYSRVRVAFRCPPYSQVVLDGLVTLKGGFTLEHLTMGRSPPQQIEVLEETPGERHYRLQGSWDAWSGEVLELDLLFKVPRRGYAKIRELVIESSDDYLNCQDHKTCLDELGKSQEGLELRNDNSLQLQCLQSSLLSHRCNQACVDWKACLNSVGSADKLLTLLLAAGVGRQPSLAQRLPVAVVGGEEKAEAADGAELMRATQVRGTASPSSCLDPRLDDPESWLCSCLDNMEATCLAYSTTLNGSQHAQWSPQRCLTALMCLDPLGQICSQWRQDADCDGPELGQLASAMGNFIASPASFSQAGQGPSFSQKGDGTRLLERARREGSGQMEGQKLDSAVRGKTSPCE